MPRRKTAGWPPAWLTKPASRRTRGDEAIDFIDVLCRVTKDSVGGKTGDPMLLRDWQKNLLRGLLATKPNGQLQHRQALIGLPRKNGKSALGAGLALWSLIQGPAGGEVYSVAGDRAQANLVFGMAKRMVQMEPDLADEVKVYRDAMEVPATGSVYRVRSAEAGLSEGLSPTFVVFDEVHVQPTRELWDVMALGFGGRQEGLLLGITTAGVRSDRFGGDSLAFGLYQHGQKVAGGEIKDPTFYFAWWEAPENADYRDRETWRKANPGFGDLVGEEDFASVVTRTPESEFRVKRCNQWVASMHTWLPAGAWDKCQLSGPVPDGAEVVLGFDGSFNGDSTALVVVTVEPTPHVDVAGVWEKPFDAPDTWRVPTTEVVDSIAAACERWQVREIAADVRLWRRELESLEDKGLPVVAYTQSSTLMTPATQRFYEAVTNKAVTQSGDPALARHMRNARTRVTPTGARLEKDYHSSPRKIDLAVAAVMAFDRASELARPDTEPEGVGVSAYSDFVQRLGPEEIARRRAEHQAKVAAILSKGRR